jgi:hypothetical protein
MPTLGNEKGKCRIGSLFRSSNPALITVIESRASQYSRHRRIGIVGPSSSHTVGPMRAGNIFINDLLVLGLLDKVGMNRGIR